MLLARATLRLPKSMLNLLQIRKRYPGIPLTMKMCLHDRYTDATTNSLEEYFWQDILVAQKLIDRKGSWFDLGSRIDGFISNISTTRVIEVGDIRLLQNNIPNVTFRQLDISSKKFQATNQYDTITCLHSLEHFGLGRYGDAVDSSAVQTALCNFRQLLAKSGALYFSTLIGVPRIEGNAHRIFSLNEIEIACEKAGLKITRLEKITNNLEHFDDDMTDSSKGYELVLFTCVQNG